MPLNYREFEFLSKYKFLYSFYSHASLFFWNFNNFLPPFTIKRLFMKKSNKNFPSQEETISKNILNKQRQMPRKRVGITPVITPV